MNKPLGLKIIAWWFVIGGALSLLLMLLLGPALRQETGLSGRDIAVSSVVSALIIVAGAGLLKTKKWGWYLGITIESLSFIYQLIAIPFVAKNGLAPSQVVAIAAGLIIYGVIITYFLRQDIREIFGISKSAPSDQ